MISATSWVPRGIASEFPEKYELNEEEMERITQMANLQLADAKEDLEEAQAEAEGDGDMEEETATPSASALQKDNDEIDDDLKEYDLEHYDDEPTDANGEPLSMFPGLANSTARYFKNEDDDMGEEEGEGEDHFITLPSDKDIAEEKAELQIYPTDNLVLATRTEDDISYLDVYVYDDGAGAPEGAEEEDGDKLDADVAKGLIRENNLYIHHDLMLPAFPLCVEWLSFQPKGANDTSNVGNFAAIGSFDPTIEIWNLDSIDKAFPDVILGELEIENSKTSSKSSKKKGKKGKKTKTGHVTTHHTDAVLSLSHNRTFRNVLASTSADTTVKLWDLTSCSVARSMNSIHSGKHVSSSEWYKTSSEDNGSILLTGGYDSQACVSDVRIEDENKMSKKWKVYNNEDIESVAWGNENTFYCGTDQGNVYCFDIRVEDKSVWTLHAHDSGISSLQVNQFIPNMISTGAMGDKVVKLWKVDEVKNQPNMVLSRDFGCGNVLTSSFAPDIEVAGNLVIGGVNSGLKMWDAFSNKTVRSAFRDQLRDLQKTAREEARRNGKSSRIARKYMNDQYSSEVVMGPEIGADDASEDEAE